MRFTKMHGAGNDYVYLDGFAQPVPANLPELARRISARHTGIGADGVILIEPSDRADARMRMFNADGSEGEMCGNGIRCVGKYVYEHGITRQEDVRIETAIGVRTVQLQTVGGTVQSARVDMGHPIFEAERIPTALQGNPPVEVGLRLDPSGFPPGQVAPPGMWWPQRTKGQRNREPGRWGDRGAATEHRDSRSSILDPRPSTKPPSLHSSVSGSLQLPVTCLSMGNPHCVVFVDQLSDAWVQGVGPVVERHPAFPNRANVEFVHIVSPTEIAMRVWERGTGETQACGTGACAATVAGALTGRTDRAVLAHLPGGDLKLEWAESGEVYLTGPAVEVFHGEWPLSR